MKTFSFAITNIACYWWVNLLVCPLLLIFQLIVIRSNFQKSKFLFVERKKWNLNLKILFFKIRFSCHNSKCNMFENNYFDCIEAISSRFVFSKKFFYELRIEIEMKKLNFQMVFKSMIGEFDCCLWLFMIVYWIYWNDFRCWCSFKLIVK